MPRSNGLSSDGDGDNESSKWSPVSGGMELGLWKNWYVNQACTFVKKIDFSTQLFCSSHVRSSIATTML
jgi:hypothetical protein